MTKKPDLKLHDLRSGSITEALGLNLREDENNPISLLKEWVQTSVEHKIVNPTAMSVSTLDTNGFPSTRLVLLKNITEEEKLVFFTNYDSEKGQHLSEHPKVSLNFYWRPLERQIRIRGIAEKTSETVNREYFYSRPKESQIASVISPQSKEISSREWLKAEFDRLQKEIGSGEVPFPGNWGGFAVTPVEFEFWQGQSNRLHDRLVYRKGDSGWDRVRVAP